MPEAKHFRQNIRAYNNALAMASFGADIQTPPGRGPYCFRIHGQIYHRIGDLHPPTGMPRSFGQLYILDTGFSYIGSATLEYVLILF